MRTKTSPASRRPTGTTHLIHRHSPAYRRQRRAVRTKIRKSQPLHRRFLLHPATVMVMLVAGVFITGWTIRAIAASYSVTAKVPAPPLTQGAVITSPADGVTVAASPITVTGSCPNNSYVKLFRNAAFSGVAWCTSNTFSISTSLSEGSNVLLAQDYNITDDPGPTTPTVTITYTPPVPPTPPSGSGSSGSPSSIGNPKPVVQLSLQSAYHFQAFKVGQEITWEVAVSGGTAPYTVHVDWGDSQASTYALAHPGTLALSHTYRLPAYYAFRVRASDARGASTLLQLIAVVRDTSAAGAITSISPTPPTANWLQRLLDNIGTWVWLAWPTYITVVLMAVSFWLGERQAVSLALQRSLHGRHWRQTKHSH